MKVDLIKKFEPYLNPKTANQGTPKDKNNPKIMSKSRVKIEERK